MTVQKLYMWRTVDIRARSGGSPMMVQNLHMLEDNGNRDKARRIADDGAKAVHYDRQDEAPLTPHSTLARYIFTLQKRS